MITQDFGSTWSLVEASDERYIRMNDMSFSEDGNIFALSSLRLFHSPDYGANWKEIPMSIIPRYSQVQFLGNGCLVVDAWDLYCNRGGYILISNDLGVTWKKLEETECPWNISSHFISHDKGYMTGCKFIKTDDSGSSWSEFTVPTPNEFTGILDFSHPDFGLLASRKKIWRTWDDGESWTREHCTLDHTIYSVSVNAEAQFIATTGGVFRFLPEDDFECSTTSLDQDVTTPIVKVYPNPNSGVLTIESHYNIERVNLLDIMGRTVYEKKVAGSIKSLSMDLDLPSGRYSLKCFHHGQTPHYQQVIVLD